MRLKFCQARKPPQPGGYATNDRDWRQNGGRRPGHRRHGGRAGQGGRPGVQRHPAATWRDCHPFPGNVSTVAMIQAIEVGPGPGPAGGKPVAFPFPPDRNRLGDPGFEDPIPGIAAARGQAAGRRHHALELHFLGPNRGGIWPETAFNIHADWGLPKPRTGKDACAPMRWRKTPTPRSIRTFPSAADAVSGFGLGAGGRSAWQGIRHAPRRFGRPVRDRNGRRGQGAGRASDRPVTNAGDYKQLSQTFTTSRRHRQGAVPSNGPRLAAGTRATSPTTIAHWPAQVK